MRQSVAIQAVLAPVLISDAGETPLAPGPCAGFRAETGNGRHLVNRGAGDRATYPDHALHAGAYCQRTMGVYAQKRKSFLTLVMESSK